MIQSVNTQAKIGLMAVGLGAYWPQFPNMREELLGHHEQLIQKFGKEYDLVQAGMVDSVETSKRAGALFKEKDVDIVFCQITTYSASETLLPAIRELDVPIILLNVQSVKALDMNRVKTLKDWLGAGITCAALPEMTAVLKRTGKRFGLITGYLDGDGIVDSHLDYWCKAAKIKRKLNKQNIALLGRPYPGMMDLNVDETNIFKKFGTYTYHLGWDDILQEICYLSDQEKREHFRLLETTFNMPDHLTSEDLSMIAEILGSFIRVVEKYNLCAIPNHFEGVPKDKEIDLLAALNPVLSILNTMGIACPVEADIKTALAMLVLKQLAGSANLAELYSMDFIEDVCIIGHSGAGDVAISGVKPKLYVSEVFHGKSGRGYVTQFYPKTGPITLLSITQDMDGDYRMIAAEGECVEGASLELGDTNCRVKFSSGLRNFINDWSSHGPTHHGALAHGHCIDALKCVSTMLDIPIEIVCR